MARILTCLDSSLYARSCADLALWAARRSGGSVKLLNVIRPARPKPDHASAAAIDTRPELFAGQAAGDVEHHRLIEAQAQALLEVLGKHLRSNGVRDVKTDLVTGDFLETLAAHEGEADVVVIGKRGESADFVTLRLGSNTEKAVRAASKPVLVAARGYDPIEKALFAFDCTPNGLKAVEAATASPLLRDGLPVELVYAGEDTGAARGALDRAASELREEGVTVTTRIVPGPPETAIPEIVAREGVGLLVMGAFGHTRLHSLVLGSTTSQLMRACKIPVLLFR